MVLNGKDVLRRATLCKADMNRWIPSDRLATTPRGRPWAEKSRPHAPAALRPAAPASLNAYAPTIESLLGHFTRSPQG